MLLSDKLVNIAVILECLAPEIESIPPEDLDSYLHGNCSEESQAAIERLETMQV